VRLAEVGQDEEARGLVELAKEIPNAEDKMLTHTKDAPIREIVQLSVHRGPSVSALPRRQRPLPIQAVSLV
jgi:hypothetical protein